MSGAAGAEMSGAAGPGVARRPSPRSSTRGIHRLSFGSPGGEASGSRAHGPAEQPDGVVAAAGARANRSTTLSGGYNRVPQDERVSVLANDAWGMRNRSAFLPSDVLAFGLTPSTGELGDLDPEAATAAAPSLPAPEHGSAHSVSQPWPISSVVKASSVKEEEEAEAAAAGGRNSDASAPEGF